MKLRSLALSALLTFSYLDSVTSSETERTLDHLRELGSLENRIPRFGFMKISRNKTSERYALLAHTPPRGASKDIVPLLCGSLVEQGYSPKDIFILDKDGTEEINYVSDGKLNSRNFNGVLTHFRGVSGNEDNLFLYLGIPIKEIGKRKIPSFELTKKDSISFERVFEKLKNTPASRRRIILDYDRNGFSPDLKNISFKSGEFSIISRSGSAKNLVDFFKIYHLKNRTYTSKTTFPDGKKVLEWYRRGFNNSPCPITVYPRGSLNGRGL